MSSERSIYSSSWYRVSDLRPRLRSHVKIHRQRFRGQLWYVLQDRASGRFHRFTPSAHFVISLMDGEQTVQEMWDLACIQLGDDVLTQDEMIRLLSQLHTTDVLSGSVPPDLLEMSERASHQRSRKLVMSMINPLAIRIPILDPDKFLTATLPFVRPLFSWYGVLLFLVTVSYALVLAGVNWTGLTENIFDRVLSAESLMMLLVTYPFVKTLHELGHAYTLKKWGGEVHEIGIMFLVFMPVPYVDASNSSAFQNKYHRALVGAAGILVEVFLASLAMLVWVNAEEGIVRAFAFNVMLIGGVSTLLFNGNPLLKFDGYYVLSDLIEIPNLGTRSTRFIAYLIQKKLFKLNNVESPVTVHGEASWMLFYAVASFCYRMFIMVTIIMFVATKFFVIGVLMAIWAIVLMLGVPLFKQLRFLFTSPLLRRTRKHALTVTAGLITLFLAVLLLVPVPYATVTEGIAWTPGEVLVHANAEGTIVEVLAQPNSYVDEGDPLIRMEDPLLDVSVGVLTARVREMQLRYADKDFSDQVEAKLVRQQLEHAVADMELALKKQNDLLIRSKSKGQFIVPRVSSLPGQFVHKGDVLGYVAKFEEPLVRVVVAEEQAQLVRRRLKYVDVRFIKNLSETFPAKVEREVPTFSDTLPSMALSTVGGGQMLLDPTDPEKFKVLANLFHLELSVQTSEPLTELGGRVFVRFVHDAEPLGWRWYRNVRQVFLKQFSV